MPDYDAAPTGALDATLHVFFTTLACEPLLVEESGWSYQPAPRKAKGRTRKKTTPAPRPTVLSPEEAAFWTLPSAAAPGAEVLTTSMDAL